MGRARKWDPKRGEIVELDVRDAPRCPWPVLHDRAHPDKEVRPMIPRVAVARACGAPATDTLAGVTEAGVGPVRRVGFCRAHVAEARRAREEGRALHLIGDAGRP